MKGRPFRQLAIRSYRGVVLLGGLCGGQLCRIGWPRGSGNIKGRGGCRFPRFYLRNRVVNVGAHLTDKKKKQIIADRVDGMSLRDLAAKHNVSVYAVRCAIKSDPTITQKITDKKEANTLDMLEFLNLQKGQAQETVKNILEAINDPDKLARTNPRDLATALGIIIDKFLNNTPQRAAAVQDDGFLKALKSSAAKDWEDHGKQGD